MLHEQHHVLQAASILTGDRDIELGIRKLAKGSACVDHVLQRRLELFLDSGASLSPPEYLLSMRASVQWLTGVWAWTCALEIHRLAESHEAPTQKEAAPILGVRDLNMLKKLVTVSFAWLIIPAILAFDAAYPSPPCLDELVSAFRTLLHKNTSRSSSLTALPDSPMAHTDVAILVMRMYFVDVLRVLIRLAYGCSSAHAHALLDALLEALPTMSVLTALRSVPMPSALASSASATSGEKSQSKRPLQPPPRFVREQCARLLSLQLLRPSGTRSLLIAMLGANEHDMLSGDMDLESNDGDASLARLDSVAKLLCTPPKGMRRTTYYMDMVPHILSVLDPVTPPGTTPVHGIHRRAAALSCVRMFETDSHAMCAAMQTHVWNVLLPTPGESPPPPASAVDSALRQQYAAMILAPPAPHWIHALCGPVLSRFLALDTHLHAPSSTPRIVDAVRESHAKSLDECLSTWLRLDSDEGIIRLLHDALRQALNESWHWQDTPQGVSLVQSSASETDVVSLLERPASLERVLRPESLDDEPHMPEGLSRTFAWTIDPARVCDILHRAKRTSVASALVLDAMEEHRRTRSKRISGLTHDDPITLERHAVYFLQLIFQLLSTFGQDLLQGDIERVLHLVDFACQDESALDTELCNTALELLLALLEQNTTLTPASTPMLRVISDKIERLRDAPNLDTRALSQELALTLSARMKHVSLASSAPAAVDQAACSKTPNDKAATLPDYLCVYEEALQSLQDPILPVRAHGLHLLTRLVSTETRLHSAPCYGHELDPALVPAILDLFLRAIQDDESFLYLNAVQGLSQMATGWREAVLRPLMAIYVGGDKTSDGIAHTVAYGNTLSQRETDQRLRIGEAMLQVLQHLGEAAVSELPHIVPPLLTAVRNPVFPASLRSSFISILGTLVETAPQALAANRVSIEMVRMCTELLQSTTERRPMRRRERVRAMVHGTDVLGQRTERRLGGSDDEDELDADDDGGARDGTSSTMSMAHREETSGIDTDVHRPTLRRSALLLLTWLLQKTVQQLDEYHEACRRDVDHVDAPLTALRLPGGGMLPDLGGRPKPVLPPLLVPVDTLSSFVPIVSYMAQEDADEIARIQARDCLDFVDRVKTAFLGG